MRRLGRLLTVVAINLALALAGGEIVAVAVGRLKLSEGYGTIASTKAQFLQRLPRHAGSPARAPVTPDNIPRVLHPYFGFTYAPGLAQWKTNDMGFMSDHPFPYVARPTELVVGIFGGSLALDMRWPGPSTALASRLQRVVAPRGWSDVTVLMMAQGAWRQPQHLYALLYFLKDIDVAITIDGFNEVALLPVAASTAAGYPADHPVARIYLPLAGRGETMEALLVEREIVELRERQAWLTEVASLPVLRRSMLVHLLWHAAERRFQRRIEGMVALAAPGAGKALTLGTPLPAPAVPDSAAVARHVERYASFLVMAHDAGRRARKPVIHVVQPNQYLTGSKRFSEEERRTALGDRAHMAPRIDGAYPLVRRMSESLRSRGIPSIDMSMVFAGVEETLYRDDCCHLNERGMTRLAEAIADAIEAGELLDELPAAPRPEGGFVRYLEGAGE